MKKFLRTSLLTCLMLSCSLLSTSLFSLDSFNSKLSNSNLSNKTLSGNDLTTAQTLQTQTSLTQQSLTQTPITKSSILQTALVPYLESQDCSTQYQSSQEQLAEIQEELAQANSEIQSLIDNCSVSSCESLLESTQDELIDTQTEFSATESILESTQDELIDTQELLSQTDSILDSTQDELIDTQAEFSVTDSILDSTQDELIDTQELLSQTDSLLDSTVDVLDTTRAEFSATDSILDSTQEELVATQDLLSQTDSIIESAQDLLFDPSVPDASAIDAIASRLGLTSKYAGVNLTDPLLDQLNIGLIPYLQAALAKLGELSPIKQIAAGGSHTVILLENGTAWATGSNASGQLGIGITGGSVNVLTKMTTNNFNISAIACGDRHTVVLKSNGVAYATGDNNMGQLGDGTFGGKNVLTPMTTNNSNISDIACGSEHTVALKIDGTAFATGDNTSGQLGTTGGTVNVLTEAEPFLGIGA